MKNEELRMKNCGGADATKQDLAAVNSCSGRNDAAKVLPDNAKRTVRYVEKGGRIMKVETRGQQIVASSCLPK